MTVNKPLYIGQAILDISKTLMYDFHYDYILPKYSNAKLLFTDTDSLCYHIETEDFYKDINPDLDQLFDTSNFDKTHELFSNKNKKVIGMFKDEAGGKQITKFCGLRSKMYSYLMDNGNEEKKCKGVKKSVIKKDIQFNDYVKCLHTNEIKTCEMNILRSHNHNMYAEKINKTALSAADTKRIILKDGISTLSHGHYALSS